MAGLACRGCDAEANSPPDDHRMAIRDKDARQSELCQIIAGREALQVKLQNLRDEVRLCEANLEALALREQQLLSEMVGQPLDDLDDADDSDSGGTGTTETPCSGPVFYELEGTDLAAGGLPSQQPCFVDLSPNLNGHVLSPREGEDYEDSFELGVAKCRHCGSRFPLDVDAIERHSKSCSRSSDRSLPLTGRCAGCGLHLPLTMEAVEAHRCSAASVTTRRKWRSR
mmetsp:Transcript_11760/g.33255  ORF Transcript_11760/g.33255 Transcript_11760/m.33255 type:complete len:227 (-) Transcript_11760:115-795(-)